MLVQMTAEHRELKLGQVVELTEARAVALIRERFAVLYEGAPRGATHIPTVAAEPEQVTAEPVATAEAPRKRRGRPPKNDPA